MELPVVELAANAYREAEQAAKLVEWDLDGMEADAGLFYGQLLRRLRAGSSDEEFDAILSRVKGEGVAFRSEHDSPDDGQINHNHQGRGFYFRDANDHSWEVITHTYI